MAKYTLTQSYLKGQYDKADKSDMLVIFICIFISTSLYAHNHDDLPKEDNLIQLQIKEQLRKKSMGSFYQVRDAKIHIINGNLEKARAILNLMSSAPKKIKRIALHYLALIHFLKNDYDSVLESLDNPLLQTNYARKKTCLLRTLTLLALNKNKQAMLKWPICAGSIGEDADQNLLWMHMLIGLKKEKNKQVIERLTELLDSPTDDLNKIRLYFKLALYLNAPELVLERIDRYGQAVYRLDELRELIGLLYFRAGKIVKANEFLEDLDTPNAEAMKGNLLLAQEKYELAYAQFKLILEKKNNSQNALSRLVPLAWKLEQWDEGRKYLQLWPNDHNQDQKDILMAAFLFMQKDYSSGLKLLQSLIYRIKETQGPFANFLATIYYMQSGENEMAKNYARKSCAMLEGDHCWLLYHLNEWPKFEQQLTSQDAIWPKKRLLDELLSNNKIQKLQGPIFIDQRDINEMDDALIQLPQTSTP